MNPNASSNSERVIWLVWPFVALGIIVLTAIAILVMARKGKRKRAGKKKAVMPLFEYVSRLTEPLSDADIVTMLMPVAKELREKHTEGLVHAGISSHSIIASKNGCHIDPKYRQGAFVAAEFVAPEQQSGKGASVKSDIYSFCRLLEYMQRAGVKDISLSDSEEPTDNTVTVTSKDKSILSEVIHKGTNDVAEYRFAGMQDIIYALAGLNTSSLSSAALAPFYGKRSKSVSAQKKRKLWIPIAVGTTLLVLTFVLNQIIVNSKLDKAADSQKYEDIFYLYPNYYLPNERIKKYWEFYCAGLDLTNGNYHDAYLRFKSLGDFYDSANLAKKSSYLYAKELLSYGEFEDAELIITDLSGYKDAEALAKECDYQKASSLAEEGNYEAAIQLFTALGEYKDSAELICETKADRGLSYLDAKQYEKALAEFKALKNDGWANAFEGINLVYYVWGNDLAQKNDYSAAFDKLSYCANYKDTAQIINKLKEKMYKQAQALYSSKSYSNAEALFKRVGTNYSRAGDYLLLINAHKSSLLKVGEIDKLISILYFQDAKTLIMRSHNSARRFLDGNWRGSGYYFRMTSNGSASYSLPYFNYGNTYRIENGKFLLYDSKTPSTTKTLFTITIIDKNTISVLCAQNGKTYTLKRD